MKFKKIYIEITNSCNFHCSFCFNSIRPSAFMSVADFSKVIEKILPFTDYIYLHVLGEPLFHPQIDEILNVAAAANVKVNITTNGSMLAKYSDLLQKSAVRQINISLHDAEENIVPSNWERYLTSLLHFATEAAPKSYINFRLWNTSNDSSQKFNKICHEMLSQKFDIPIENIINLADGQSLKLSEHIFLQAAARFEWPDMNGQQLYTSKNCYALRDHIAILSDGTVVPCCLDGDGHLSLGNLFTEELVDILQKERAVKMKKGFEERKVIESFCGTCGFMQS